MKKSEDLAKKDALHGKLEIMTPNEVAAFLRVSRRKINHLVATKAVPFVRIGKRVVRFRRQAVMKWLREQNGKREER